MKIAIVNTSDIAKRKIIPALKAIPGIDIVLVCSRDINKAKLFAKEFDILNYTNDLYSIENVDAVYISTPTGLHTHYINIFIDKGINVFCEKSLTTDLNETIYLINKAERNGVIIQENYAFEFHSQWEFIKKHIPTIGNLQYIKSSFEFPPRNTLTDFRYQKTLGGGCLYDAGGYPIKLASLILDDVYSYTATNRISNKHNVDIGGNCYITDIQGTSAFLTWSFQSTYKCNVEIVGDNGTIKSNRIFTPTNETPVEVTVEYLNNETKTRTFIDDHFINILVDFKRRIENNDNSHHKEIIKQSNWQSDVSTCSISTDIK